MKRVAALCAVLTVMACLSPAATAQRRTPPSTAQEVRELREEVRALKDGQEAMQKDLQEIKRLLQQARGPAQPQAPAMPEFVSVDDDPSIGSADARVVMIDFSDYQ